MNAGLSNLTTLKAFLLSKGLQGNTGYDTGKILPIGLGVADMIDTWCNRKFAYATGEEEVFTGDRPHYYLHRFPVINISDVNMRYFITDNWTDIEGEPLQWNQTTGLLAFGYTLGRAPLQVQVIYDGGYFYETLEPGDPGYPTARPAGSTPLPPSVQLAWLLQCAETWNKIDKLGKGISEDPDVSSGIAHYELSPGVKQMLQPFKRLQLS